MEIKKKAPIVILLNENDVVTVVFEAEFKENVLKIANKITDKGKNPGINIVLSYREDNLIIHSEYDLYEMNDVIDMLKMGLEKEENVSPKDICVNRKFVFDKNKTKEQGQEERLDNLIKEAKSVTLNLTKVLEKAEKYFKILQEEIKESE